MNFKLRNKLLRLLEMQSSNNYLKKKLEEEQNTNNLKTLEMNYRFKNKKKEQDKLKEKNSKRE
jgi:hypothetical protein